MSLSVSGGSLLIDGTPLSLFSASFQYWRVPYQTWDDVLKKIKELGFRVVETYVPWSVHEIFPGEYDFGRIDPKKDIRGFLEACARENLYVIIRPGPHINAEITYFGFPERLFHHPEIFCRSANGAPVYLPAVPRMFPVPCYHHPKFLSEFETYINNLASEIGNLTHPAGPIIAIQVDNECCKFFRAHPFDHDYSKYSIRLYRRFLKEKYGSLGLVSAAHRKEYESWSRIDPPRSFQPSSAEELPLYMDWVEYGEYYINESLRSIHRIMKRHFGEEFVYFHNYPCAFPSTPLDLKGVERFLDFESVDMYPSKSSYDTLKMGGKYVSAMSRFPHLAEFASGNLFMGTPLTLDDHRFASKAALMHGFKGINYYMIVERERWYGSPIRNDGTTREDHCKFFKDFLAFVSRLNVEKISPRRDVLLLVVREYERLADAATLLKPLSRMTINAFGLEKTPRSILISEENYGLSEPVAERYLRVFEFWYKMLSICGAHFAVGEVSMGLENLSKYKLVVAPTFEFMSGKTQEILLEYSKRGGALILGPRKPSLNERMEPVSILGEYMRDPEARKQRIDLFGVEFDEVFFFSEPASVKTSGDERPLSITGETNSEAGKIIFFGALPAPRIDLESLEALKPLMESLLLRAGIEPHNLSSDPRLEVSVFEDSERMILFLANPTPKTLTARVSRVSSGAFLNLETGEIWESSGSLEISLCPWDIMALERVEE